MMDNTDISKIYKTFSGTDSLVFILLPQTAPILLGTITTLSYSIFRDKKPVPLLGRINVGGFTRGTRVVAGTMIFTLINQHWINDLVEQVPWLKAYGSLKADELPLFDVMIVSANEYGAHIQMFIYGIDITDEGQVLSVEDMFTENQFSFIARDLDTFTNTDYSMSDYKKNYTIDKIGILQLGVTNQVVKPKTNDGFDRNLSLNTSNMMTGNDVKALQQKLKDDGYSDITVDSIFGPQTANYLSDFQSKNGLNVTGSTDDATLERLSNGSVTSSTSGVITAKEGAKVYSDASVSSRVVTTLNYKDNITISDNSNGWIKTNNGYIISNAVYSTLQSSNDNIGSVLRYQSTGIEVEKLQRLLNNAIPGTLNELTITGIMDNETVNRLKLYQSIKGLTPDGVVNADTWLSLSNKGVEQSV